VNASSALRPQQGHPGTVGARDGAHSERRHLGQQLRQTQTARYQARQRAHPGPQVGVVGDELFLGQRPVPCAADVPGELRHQRLPVVNILPMPSIGQSPGDVVRGAPAARWFST
jgi:hypothetical protein